MTAQIHLVPDRGQSGVIRTVRDRGQSGVIRLAIPPTEQAATYRFNATGVANGSYSANTLNANFDNAAGSSALDVGVRYVIATDDATFTLKGKTETRDQEITTDARRGLLYLRMTASGKAYVLKIIPSINLLEIGVSNNGLTETSGDSPNKIYTNDAASTVIPGFNTPAQTDSITFGVSGFDVYVKYNNVERLRFKSRFHIVKGKPAIKIHDGGCSFLTVKYFARATLYSNTDAKVYDVRDFGWKADSTTGSITAGSNLLTVASVGGLAVGNKIIVELGGEATFNGRAAGMRGTKGGNGAHPTLSYANAAAMNADNSQPNGRRAWVEDSGFIKISTSGTWAKASTPVMIGEYLGQTAYYDEMALPKALQAFIVSISGNVLTLSKTSAVTITNANVYFDNNFIITKLCQEAASYYFVGDYPVTDAGDVKDLSAVEETGDIISIPAGTYRVGEQMYFTRAGITLRGAGADLTIIKSPKGTASFNIKGFHADNTIIEDLQFVGNAGLNGFGSLWEVSYPGGIGAELLTQDEAVELPEGVKYITSLNIIARNCKLKDIFRAAFATTIGCTNAYRYNIDLYITDPQQQYLSWLFQDASSNNGTFENCHFSSPWITKCFESFNSLGTQFINCTAINGLFSCNDAGDFLWNNCSQTFTGNNKPASVHAFEPCVNINTNFGADLAHGGEIIDHTILFQDYVDDRHDVFWGIQTAENNSGLLITRGSYTAPNWQSPADRGPMGIRSEGVNITVDGFVVVGSQVNNFSFNKTNIGLLNGTVRNCTAEYFHVRAGVTYTNNTGTKVIVP